MLPATFMMAFKGIRSKLTRRVNVSSSGLLVKLLDGEVISQQERESVKVPAQVLRDFCCVGVMFTFIRQTSRKPKTDSDRQKDSPNYLSTT